MGPATRILDVRSRIMKTVNQAESKAWIYTMSWSVPRLGSNEYRHKLWESEDLTLDHHIYLIFTLPPLVVMEDDPQGNGAHPDKQSASKLQSEIPDPDFRTCLELRSGPFWRC